MEARSHLSIILDLAPVDWELSATWDDPLPLSSFLSQLLVFINAHLAQSAENTLAVFGAFPNRSTLLYSSIDVSPSSASESSDPNWYLPFRVVDGSLVQQIQDGVDSIDVNTKSAAPTAIVGALTKALCYINRLEQANIANNNESSQEAQISIEPRILILALSSDRSVSYVPLMNAIFSAQKLKVTIDVCKLGGSPTVFLQQATHLTEGAFVHLEQRGALLQTLIMAFSTSESLRSLFTVPNNGQVDFRASCFCHRNIVDIGFVCSVCLSIFCTPLPVCSTCKTKFPFQTVASLKKLGPMSIFKTSSETVGSNGTSNPS